ncbi:MAG TPA: orotidine-5'-phosphate decarboxylase [Burkholderiales bacterium]|nr:orotidine-5'-phosphate decarboxylase [Burkholderiales bacterium]
MNGSRLIVALDFATAAEAQAFAARVTPSQCRLKVGLELFTAAGPALVSELVGRGFDVFLDLKYHDIPNTVARACTRAADLGVWMLNVHALGGRQMLEAARAAVDQAAHHPLLIGVTVLTSHEEHDMADLGLPRDIGAQVERLAQLAQDCRLDGVVCSPREAERLRRRCGKKFSLVTPGIRPANAPTDDQRRTLTPGEAIAQGADYLVIGRPVTRAPDPAAVLAQIADDVRQSPRISG